MMSSTGNHSWQTSAAFAKAWGASAEATGASGEGSGASASLTGASVFAGAASVEVTLLFLLVDGGLISSIGSC